METQMMEIKKLEFNDFKKIIFVQDKILEDFKKITGINDNLDIQILYISEEFQSDCDGDDNHINVKITHKIGGIGLLKEKPIDIVEIHRILCENFELMPKVEQLIHSFKDHPYLKTTFIFNYYNITES